MRGHSRSLLSIAIIVFFALLLTLSIVPLPLGNANNGIALADPGTGWEAQKVDFAIVANGIAAIDANTAWAVGGIMGTSEGRIFKTVDGGEHWASQLTLSSVGSLNDICAVNEKTAWAVSTDMAKGSSIVKTEDGGSTWNTKNQLNGIMLMGISALDCNVAVAVGGTIIVDSPPGQFPPQFRFVGKSLVTVDGGTTWSTLLERDNDMFMDVALIDVNTAWIIGHEVLKTTDAGVSWQSQYSFPSYGTREKIDALDANNAWFVSSGLVCKTTNGVSWQPCTPDTSNQYNDVSVVDQNTVWVAGGGTYTPYEGNEAVYRTEDGGATWDKMLPGLPLYVAVCAVDGETAWASGMLALQKTTDGGATWEVQGESGIDSTFLCVGALSPDFAAIGGMDGMSGYALPDLGGVLAWPGPAIDKPVSSDIWGISLFSEIGSLFMGFDAWMAGSAGMIYRMDQASGSYTFPDPGIDNDFYDISALDMNTAWAVGQDVIVKTSDGGTTWSIQVNAPLKINGVSAVDASTAWAVAEGGLAGKTTDGTTWNAMSTGTTNNLNDVSALDALSAWAVGAGGTIVKTTNGGVSWTVQTSGTTADLFGISAVDTSIAWAVGAGGTILKTTDGGATWMRQDSKTANTLYDVCAVDADMAWAVGDHNTVLKTTDGGGPAVAFTVTSIVPNTASQFAWAMDLQVAGTGFQPGAAVRLEKGTAVLNAYNVNVLSSTQITCTVGFFGAEPGAYDVVVNPGGQEARLPGAFTVTSPCGAGSGTAMLMLGLTLGLLSLAGTAGWRKRRK